MSLHFTYFTLTYPRVVHIFIMTCRLLLVCREKCVVCGLTEWSMTLIFHASHLHAHSIHALTQKKLQNTSLLRHSRSRDRSPPACPPLSIRSLHFPPAPRIPDPLRHKSTIKLFLRRILKVTQNLNSFQSQKPKTTGMFLFTHFYLSFLYTHQLLN